MYVRLEMFEALFSEYAFECAGCGHHAAGMMVQAVYNPGESNGFVYTIGLAEHHPSKTEFICFNCPRELLFAVSDMFRFLADRLTSGVTVCANQTCLVRGIYFRTSAFSKADNASLLRSHACQCCEQDTTLLRLMPGGTVNDMPVLVPAIATSTHDGRWSLNDPQGVFGDCSVLDLDQICHLTR
jgi:hypothetical protein